MQEYLQNPLCYLIFQKYRIRTTERINIAMQIFRMSTMQEDMRALLGTARTGIAGISCPRDSCGNLASSSLAVGTIGPCSNPFRKILAWWQLQLKWW